MRRLLEPALGCQLWLPRGVAHCEDMADVVGSVCAVLVLVVGSMLTPLGRSESHSKGNSLAH